MIYYLPKHPVSFDGCTVIYGTRRVIHCLEIQRGDAGWQSDPALAAARLLILPRKVPLTLLLRLDTPFKAVYEDDVAVVFVRRQFGGKMLMGGLPDSLLSAIYFTLPKRGRPPFHPGFQTPPANDAVVGGNYLI